MPYRDHAQQLAYLREWRRARQRPAADSALQAALARLEAAHAALSWSHPMTIVAVLRALVLVVTLLAQARHNK